MIYVISRFRINLTKRRNFTMKVLYHNDERKIDLSKVSVNKFLSLLTELSHSDKFSYQCDLVIPTPAGQSAVYAYEFIISKDFSVKCATMHSPFPSKMELRYFLNLVSLLESGFDSDKPILNLIN